MVSTGDRDLGEAREGADVGEHHAGLDVLAAEGQSGLQELLRHLGGRELSEQLPLPVAKPLLLEAGADAGLEQHRVDRLEEVVLGAHLDAPGHAVHLLHRGHHHHREVAEAADRRPGPPAPDSRPSRASRCPAGRDRRGAVRRASRPSRPFSAKVTVCPSCSRARPSKRRFTRLSSTTRSRPDCASAGEAMSKRPSVAGDELVLCGEPLDPVADLGELPDRPMVSSSRARMASLDGAQALAGGLERSAPRGGRHHDPPRPGPAGSSRSSPRASSRKVSMQLDDEGAVHGGGEPIECHPVDRAAHVAARPRRSGRKTRARLPPRGADSARARPPAPRREWAWRRSRPSPPPCTAPGRPPSRWRSWRRAAGGARPATAG